MFVFILVKINFSKVYEYFDILYRKKKCTIIQQKIKK